MTGCYNLLQSVGENPRFAKRFAAIEMEVSPSIFFLSVLLCGATPPFEERQLLERKARSHFERGEYPACEEALKKLLEDTKERSAKRVELLCRLARVQVLQGASSEAIDTVKKALPMSDAPGVHETAVFVFLRGQFFEAALPHLDALLRVDPSRAMTRFSRGIVLSKTGRRVEALRELEYGLKDPSTRRQARFEIALILSKTGKAAEALRYLQPILEEDPYDDQACFQASRQLLRLPKRSAPRTAALLAQYFQTLREKSGESSRDQHLAAAGKPVEAALRRAARWERLGGYSRALGEVEEARRMRPASTSVGLYLTGFWLRRGLLREAEAELDRLGKARLESAAGQVRELREGLRKAHLQLGRGESTPLLAARRKLAAVGWSAAGDPLKVVLRLAAAGHVEVADGAARLLLAKDRRSREALRHMVERTRHPTLIIPHTHYLARLSAAEPEDPLWKKDAERCRSLLVGNDLAHVR